MAIQSPSSFPRVSANSFHSRTADPQIERTEVSSARNSSPAFRRVLALLAAIMDRRARAEDAMVARYSGHRWGDTTERKLIEDIVDPRHTRW
jgi:hypothetical protein